MTDKKSYKVLIVDDDKFLLDVYSVKFREFGHVVNIAFGGEEAIEKIKAHDDYDAIIVDIVMPNMDGFEFLAKIKEKGLAQNSSIIILTNQGENKDLEKAKKYDVDGYIVKASTIPSDVLKEVLEIIEENIGEVK